MHSKSTFWLMIAALGLGGYIFLFERHSLNTDERAQQAAKLFPDFDPANVASVEILRSNNVKFIRAERANDQWRLVQPAYPAQSTAIDNWLGLFRSLDRRTYLSAQDLLAQPGGLTAFGLDSPQATVMIQQGTRKIHILLGAKTPVGEKLYLQQVGSDGVFVTDSALLDRLPQSATDWRDPTFLDFSALKFDRLHVRAGQRDFEVERGPGGPLWRLTKPRLARADNALLQRLYQQLQTARVSQFVSDTPGSDLEPYGLQTPEVTLVFSQGANSVLTVEFGKSPTNYPGQVFARRSNYPTIVTVPKHLLDLLRAPYTDFLDKHLIEFPVAAVERIEARADEPFALQKQINGAWRIVEPYSAPADPAWVRGFLDRLNALPIVEVEKEVVTDSDLPNYGLAPAARQYTLKSARTAGGTNQLLAQIEFGTNQTDKVYARRIDESSVYVTRLNESPLPSPLPTAAFELRDRHIWNFSTNQVTGLTIEFKGKTYQFQRNSRGQLSLAPGSQGMLNPFALDEALFRLGQLSSKAWVACGKINPAQYGFSSPPHKLSIQINRGDKPQALTVEFGAQSLSGGPYALVDLDGRPTVFDFPFEIFHVYFEVVRSLTITVGATP
jgi:Domain of unknown function (DUF4340)